MRHLVIPAVAALALLAGCKDLPRKNLTEPAPDAAAAAAVRPAANEAKGESSLCAAYRHQLGEARASLARSAEEEALRERVSTYEAVIADACP